MLSFALDKVEAPIRLSGQSRLLGRLSRSSPPKRPPKSDGSMLVNSCIPQLGSEFEKPFVRYFCIAGGAALGHCATLRYSYPRSTCYANATLRYSATGQW